MLKGPLPGVEDEPQEEPKLQKPQSADVSAPAGLQKQYAVPTKDVKRIHGEAVSRIEKQSGADYDAVRKSWIAKHGYPKSQNKET